MYTTTCAPELRSTPNSLKRLRELDVAPDWFSIETNLQILSGNFCDDIHWYPRLPIVRVMSSIRESSIRNSSRHLCKKLQFRFQENDPAFLRFFEVVSSSTCIHWSNPSDRKQSQITKSPRDSRFELNLFDWVKLQLVLQLLTLLSQWNS